MPPRVVLLAVALAIAPGCHTWTKQDTLLEVGFAVATMADWAQTKGIVSICHEKNPLIGECGEGMSPDLYFPLSLIAHAAISAALPPRMRMAWQAVGIGAQLNQVWHNNALGYGLDGSVPPPPPGFRYRMPGEKTPNGGGQDAPRR